VFGLFGLLLSGVANAAPAPIRAAASANPTPRQRPEEAPRPKTQPEGSPPAASSTPPAAPASPPQAVPPSGDAGEPSPAEPSSLKAEESGRLRTRSVPAKPPGERDSALTGSLLMLADVLRDAAQDLQLGPCWIAPPTTGAVNEEALIHQAAKGWAIGSQLLLKHSGLVLRLTVVAPRTESLRVSRTSTTQGQLEVDAIRALRNLTDFPPAPTLDVKPAGARHHSSIERRRSRGKATLAVHGALVGGYVGFSLEHAGGSGDARLTYPLMALGAGAGVGASLVIAEEWDVSEAEARYVWAAGTWPTIAALLIASERLDGETSPHLFGIVGAATGLSLGALSLSLGDLKSGGDDLAHSGAGFGALLGALGEMMIKGDTQLTPLTGIGAGMGVGVVAAGAIAPQVEVSRSRVLFSDLSATLGALLGAALASPILVGDRVTKSEHRIFLGSTATGALAGGAVGIWVTRERALMPPTAFSMRPVVGSDFLGLAGQW
jgi:hypothetical protein